VPQVGGASQANQKRGMQTWFTRIRERPDEEYIGSRLQDTVGLSRGDA